MLQPYMHLGGGLMWLIWICSLLLGAILIERFWTVGVRKILMGAELARHQAQWHRRVLPFFVEVPTSLGLLGTVVGIVIALRFDSGRIDSQNLVSGLGMATLTTIAGLSVAIVASISGYVLDWLTTDPEKDGL